MKRVLVTGAFGYVGRFALEPLLDRGFEVLALSPRQRTIEDSRIRVVQADLFDTCRTGELLELLAGRGAEAGLVSHSTALL